jgi:hypothetical protein
VKRCKKVRVKLKRHGKVVKRHGKPVYRRMRRCRKVPSPGCRFVKVKKRTKSGRVVRRKGKVVYRRVERCPPKKPAPRPAPGPAPGPGPSPGTATQLANRVLALAPRQPVDIDLFTSSWSNGAQGLYPQASAMVPASGPLPSDAEVRSQLSGYLNRWFAGDGVKVNAALAIFDNDDVEAVIPDAKLRAAFAAMKGTLFEPTQGYVLTLDRFAGIDWGSVPNRAVIASSTGGDTDRIVIFSDVYRAERFELLIATMGHELLHDDAGTAPRPEEVVLNAFSGMTQLQVLARTPGLAHLGTELARQDNTQAMLFLNSRERGSPDSEIYAPTGTGVAPGSPHNAADFWTIYTGNASTSPGSATLRTILGNIFVPGTPLPATLEYSQSTAELFAKLNDGWLSDVQRAQISVLLRLVTVEQIAQATGLAQQQIVATLGLQPYLDAIP